MKSNLLEALIPQKGDFPLRAKNAGSADCYVTFGDILNALNCSIVPEGEHFSDCRARQLGPML
jgi:hypothetical protein